MSSKAFSNWTSRLGWPRRRPDVDGAEMIASVRSEGASLARLPTEQLQQRAKGLREAADGRLPSDGADGVAATFALVNEALRRTHGMEFYDVQLLASRALVRGAIAQMATGEGKTLVQLLAASAYALAGRGVHLMTTNAYLAERDYQQLAPVLACLGISAGLLNAKAAPHEKRQVYLADVTFGPGYEYGFDYLRDQVQLQQRAELGRGKTLQQALRGRSPQPVPGLQRGHAVAIVDEIDSVLIDEATTPLVLSGAVPADHDTSPSYHHAGRVADVLQQGVDFVVDEPSRRVQLTEQGMKAIQHSARLPQGMRLDRPWPVYIEQALFAQQLLHRDVDYVVADDLVMLVDQFTGRVFEDRSLSNGLHQAVEAREGVPLTDQQTVLGRISRQQYFQLYETVCGMTGTAEAGRTEFLKIYQLPVTVIPTRCSCRRTALPVQFFAGGRSKREAIAEDVRQRKEAGQPVLIGTPSIEDSRLLAEALEQLQVPYELLNGVQDVAEAEIVSRAGRIGAVTIATNIAGRGTDIKLGEAAADLGGLHVIVSEPHQSSRIDRQLIGRCARQGDPGTCQTFVSAEDPLIHLHAPRLARRMHNAALPDGAVPLDLTAEVAAVQRRVEQADFQRRRQMMSRSTWMEDVMAKLAGRQSE